MYEVEFDFVPSLGIMIKTPNPDILYNGFGITFGIIKYIGVILNQGLVYHDAVSVTPIQDHMVFKTKNRSVLGYNEDLIKQCKRNGFAIYYPNSFMGTPYDFELIFSVKGFDFSRAIIISGSPTSSESTIRVPLRKGIGVEDYWFDLHLHGEEGKFIWKYINRRFLFF